MLGKNHDDSNRNDDKNYDNVNSKVVKSLGSWFPSATIYKVDFDYYNNKTITICLFYQYIIPNWNHKQLNNIMKLIRLILKY